MRNQNRAVKIKEAAQPRPETDIEQRMAGFNEELKAILKKYEVALGAQAFLTDDGRIQAQVRAISSRNIKMPPTLSE